MKNFIKYDKLISPINGYECRIITKQNIKKFGFETIEQFKFIYPEFPLCCEELSKIRALKCSKENKTRNYEIATKKKQNSKSFYNLNPKYCLKCNSKIKWEKRNNKFCSQKCANVRIITEQTKQKISNSLRKTFKNLSKQHIKIKTCNFCSSDYTTKGIYCSEECKISGRRIKLSLAGRKSASNRNLRSKDEILLAEMCRKLFNIETNKPIFNGWDADILIPEYKLAILWNGPWHYKEMYIGNHSLKQVVNRDIIKMIEAEKMGWNILIYEDNKWAPETAFIDIILHVNEIKKLVT